MILLEKITGIYYRVKNIGVGPYVAGTNQKIENNYNWINGKTKDEVIWKDDTKEIILKPQTILDIDNEKVKREKVKQALYQVIDDIIDGNFTDLGSWVQNKYNNS